MSKEQQTFTDPKSGEEIESTWLARVVPRMLVGLLIGLGIGMAQGMGTELLVVLPLGILCIGLLFLRVRTDMEKARRNRLIRWAHDTIARRQHRRRILRSKEDQDVPDGAISRAQPPGEPQVTDAALSLTDTTEGAGRLSVDVIEDAEAVVDDNA